MARGQAPFSLHHLTQGRIETKKLGGRGIPPESIVLIWKYIQQHIQILVAHLGPIYLPWQYMVQRQETE